MNAIEDTRQPGYVKYPLVDILIIVMLAVLCGLDTFGGLVIYTTSKKRTLYKRAGH